MATSTNNVTTRIFVGNIPYDFDENELVDTLEMVGPIKEIEIKIDEKNNKPKGFGFCTYKDVESRISALKNLKNIDYNGRQLRINTAENERNILVTEDAIRGYRDLAFIDDFSSFDSLSNDQKNLLFTYCKILYDKNPQEFENLLMNQDESFLTEFLSFQCQMLNKIHNK
jgi:RNA recognition motif-containing protein